MPLPDLLPILPFTRPMRGEVTLPGSKSLTNRALLLAALCDQPVTLTGALFSEDTELMAEALRKVGFTVHADATARTLRVSNQKNGFSVEKADLFVGLAGTAARFLTALCAAAPRGVYRLDGVPQMRKRPMKGLIDALRALGADLRCLGVEGFFPIEIHARGLAGGAVEIDASESSQMLSALLMAAPLARQPVDVRLSASVREPFVEMTAQLMSQFGIDLSSAAGRYVIPKQNYHLTAPWGAGTGKGDASYPIEPDATAASYFLALPLVAGGALKMRHLTFDSLQGDVKFAEVMKTVGLDLTIESAGFLARFAGGKRQGVRQDFSEFSDTFLTLAAISPLLEGPTRISGIAHTRKQETDRVAGMARELIKLGQEVIETEDALEIHPRPLRTGQTIETYHDHRFAMSFGILGCHDLHGDGRPWLTIKDPGCCAKTFPHFFDLLDAVRTRSVEG
jgi:3-phosphoshikimate 1-carboxyvinyltransferase